MGSQVLQAALWGRNARDWASVQEDTGGAGYEFALEQLPLSSGVSLLDVGCGSGVFCSLAVKTGATVTGFDATAELIALAKVRVPDAIFFVGDMETLPFPDASFDVVTGFNSFQYAASVPNALAEARRVLKPGGLLLLMIWGNKQDNEAASYLATLGSLLPPPPPGAPGPFALTENNRLQDLLTEAGWEVVLCRDLPVIWDYPDMDTALTGLLSAGPATRAIEHSGFEKVRAATLEDARRYEQANGHVVYRNSYRIVLAK